MARSGAWPRALLAGCAALGAAVVAASRLPAHGEGEIPAEPPRPSHSDVVGMVRHVAEVCPAELLEHRPVVTCLREWTMPGPCEVQAADIHSAIVTNDHVRNAPRLIGRTEDHDELRRRLLDFTQRCLSDRAKMAHVNAFDDHVEALLELREELQALRFAREGLRRVGLCKAALNAVLGFLYDDDGDEIVAMPTSGRKMLRGLAL
mmetsp:Transcript_82414/g.229343  ORF Transcript_82414/g.229343 Transcript_82414/m.229343 type:complete len:205 (-) Transcript_82414:105-719(-)